MPVVDRELVGSGGELPSPPMTTGNFLKEIIKKNLEDAGDCVWMTDVSTGKSLKYSELLIAIDKVACALRKRGLQPKDTVIYVASNYIEVPVMFFGVWAAGGINAGLTPNLFPAHIRTRAIETGAKFVLTDEEHAALVLEGVKELDSVKEVFIIGEHPDCTSFDVLLEDGVEVVDENISNFDNESVAWLMYSSGTTGTPKCIIHTHSSVNKLISLYRGRFCPRRKFLYMNYMINAGGMSITIAATVSHTLSHCLSQCSDDKFLRAIDQVKPFQISCFPTQIAWICKHPQLDTYDLNSVVALLTTGSCMNPIFEREIFDKFPGLVVLNVTYAMSEALVIAAPNPVELETLNKEKAIARHVIGSCGKILPFNKLKIIDPNSGEKLSAGQVGEICVKTVYLTKGYLNRPDETANAIRDGWFHTGDQGYYDSNENIFVIGRYKELIKYRMAHVVPTNIEKHLMSHPAVEDAAVVGLPHDIDGELPCAFVVLKSGQLASAEELIQFTNERVIDEEHLRGGVRFVEKIPRNDLGKIVRHLLMKFIN